MLVSFFDSSLFCEMFNTRKGKQFLKWLFVNYHEEIPWIFVRLLEVSFNLYKCFSYIFEHFIHSLRSTLCERWTSFLNDAITKVIIRNVARKIFISATRQISRKSYVTIQPKPQHRLLKILFRISWKKI